MILTHHFSIPFGTFLVVGGLVGLLLSGSVTSFLFGGVMGGAILALGFVSRRDYLHNKQDNQFQSSTYTYCLISLILSVIVTLVMGDRFQESGKFMPSGLVALISAGASGFYVFQLSSGDVGTHAKRAKNCTQ